MDLSLTPTQELLKRTSREFLEAECPLTLVRDLDRQGQSYSPELWRKIAALGWCGMLIPEEYGGLGSSLADLGVLYEQMGRALLPTPHHSSAVLAPLILLAGGSPDQRQACLPRLAAGETIMACAITEADYGWTPAQVQLRAEAGGGGFMLQGAKLYVHDAAIADTLLVAARTGAAAGDITLFLVDAHAPGVAVRALTGFTGETQHEVRFDGVQVGAEAVVGEIGAGWRLLEQAFSPATAILCAYMVGGMDWVRERTVQYSQDRKQFGVPVGSFQRVQDHIVEMLNHLDASRWTAYEALWRLDNHDPKAAESVAIAKAVASEGYERATFHAHEVHAGIGISREYGLYLYTKMSRTLYSYLGDPAHHRKRIAQLLEL